MATKTFCFLVLSIIFYNINSIPLSPPNLPFSCPQDIESAKEYAVKLCEAHENFFKNTESVKSDSDAVVAVFEDVYGLEDDLMDDKSMVFFDGRPLNGYNEIKTHWVVARRLITFDPGTDIPCQQSINDPNADFKCGPNWISYIDLESWELDFVQQPKSNKHRSHHAGTFRYQFDSQTNLIKKAEMSAAGFLAQVLEKAMTASNAAISSAEYLGFIEKQIKGSNESIKMLSNVLIGIIVFVAILFTCIIGLCVNMMITKNKTAHY